ncbi:hypothetical protein BC830DRAFT_497872 [Chytriomyces sp. MP71]|nr:hypothetical protein BC830DRAFT_497872 [Chytriomyces sp. MP71]
MELATFLSFFLCPVLSSQPSRKMGKKNTSGEASVPATSSDFPRGGAASGALTSLEWRDASERAAKELFNEANEAAAVEGGSGGDKAKRKKKKRVQEQDAPEPKRAKVDAAEKKESIASLTFKKLNPGFALLGVIKEISDLELTVSLPNQMTGSVSITEISDEITAIVEKVSQAESGQEEENQDVENTMNNDTELPALNHLFKIGQALPVLAIYTEKASFEGGPSKRKIELSIKPARMNASVEVEEIREGMNLLASVKSVEDNGYILSFGFKSNTTTHGFLHKKHASAFIKSFDASIEKTTLAVGQVVYVSILSVDAGKRTIAVTADPEAIAKSVVPTSHNVAFPSLRPGLLIPTRVKSILDGSGVIVSFMGLFEGTIELGHLGDKARDGTELEKAFKVGQKLQPRILYVDSVRKRIGFTLLPSIVSWTTEMALATLQETEIGTILENTTVSRVDGELGLVMSVENGLTGYVHVSRLTDKDDAKIEPSKKHAPGTTHKTRVVGYDVCDNLLQLTMKPSVLNATFMRRSDVKVGMIVKGTVTKVEDYGLMVNLADGISALVPRTHLAESTVANPGKMFKIGSSVKARVR